MTNSAALPSPEAKTSAQAVWSLVFGILSLTCLWLLGSIPAIILGILALKAIDQSGGTVKGRGLGIAGIVTGAVGVVAGIAPLAIVASLALPAFSGVQEKAKEARQMSDIRQLLFACKAFAAENNGNYPGELPELLAEGHIYEEELLYANSGSSTAGSLPFLYRPGMRDSSSGDEPLIASPEAISGKRIVGFCDGSVSTLPEAEFQSSYSGLFPMSAN